MRVNEIIQGDCLAVLKEMPDNSVDCCITSPPYWGLRDYGINGQLGGETDFRDFISNLVKIFNEVKRVIKPTGTCFVNLGDTYAGSGAGTTKNVDVRKYINNSKQVYVLPNGMAVSSKYRETSLNKSLLMVPERFAITMIDKGWVLRNQIIWHKPNAMPNSVKDRFTVDFEKIFFFVKKAKGYYFEQQLEAYTKPLDRWGEDILTANRSSAWDDGTNQNSYRNRNMRPNPAERNKRTVWSVNTKPYHDAHFAVYPEELVAIMIKAGCPENGVVLDPFMGSGTTAVVARKLNRNFIGIELNSKYIKLANKRLEQELGLFL